MTTFQDRFHNFIQEKKLFGKNDPVLLAVSGGVDSIVMSHLFHECGFAFEIAHINFGLRGNDSVTDENFVHEFAKSRGKKFFIAHFNTAEVAREKNISIQMAARELRYAWLEEVRKENGFHRIALAHHLDDSIETVFLNVIRGTGIHGLHGILPRQNKIVRPLLCFFKKEIEEYAVVNKISFRQDLSNYETDYDRNKIRLEVTPQIEKHFPSFKKVFKENIEKWKDAEELYNESLERAKKKISTKKIDEMWISISKLKSHPAYKAILFEVLKEFEFNTSQSGQVVEALESESGKMFLSASHRLIKDRTHLIISPITSNAISEILILKNDHLVSTDKIQLKISEHASKDFSIPKEARFSCLNEATLEFPLLLRRWKKGDYFYPFGMKRKKKKISDYLIDRKIPLSGKENTWVIESGKRICCILGERIDERFKITPSTSTILMIEKKSG